MAEEKNDSQQNEKCAEKDNAKGDDGDFQPGPGCVDVSPDQCGGVWKEVLREGDGKSPQAGDTVSVHYVGTLTDGTPFDSSRDRGELFEFKLGKGNVIKAWDVGVATMKKGELAKLYCKPEFAYGEAGSPPKIPPNATLIFEVELFSWKGDDLSPNKNGGIMRQKIEAGEGLITPNDGAMVTVHLIGRHKGVVFETREVTFCLGEGSEHGIVEGLERALEKFKKLEKSTITLQPEFAFGEAGNKELNIPANAEVEYEVTLKNFEKAKESWELENSEKLEQGNFFKTKGTRFFKEEKYNLAAKQYKKILGFVEHMSGMKENEETEQKQLTLAAHLNLALCYLKENDNLKALDACEKALEMDETNEKGLFRRGLACLGLNETELAKNDFQKVLAIDPKNKAAAAQIKQCNNKIREHKERERKLYGNMFTKFAMQDLKREQRSGGDVLANPGTWGEEDSYFKNRVEGDNEMDKEKLAAQEKMRELDSAVDSEELVMVP